MPRDTGPLTKPKWVIKKKPNYDSVMFYKPTLSVIMFHGISHSYNRALKVNGDMIAHVGSTLLSITQNRLFFILSPYKESNDPLEYAWLVFRII